MNDTGNIKEKNTVLILDPNLGHPSFLNIDKKLKNRKFEFDLILATSIPDTKDLETFLENRIKLTPIFEYKWKLKRILKKERKKRILRKLFGKESKNSSLWLKIKNLFKKSKKTEKKEKKIKITPKEKQKRLKIRAYRGDPLDLMIDSIIPTSLIKIEEQNKDDLYSPQVYLMKQAILEGAIKFFYKVKVLFKLDKEIIKFLRSHNFVMFDIAFRKHDNEEGINHHSLVVTKNNWENFTFIHATDLHLAERNDRVYEIVKKWTSLFRKKQFLDITEKSVKTASFFKRMFHKKQELKVERIKPLHRRFINPNNNFRRFIRIINRKVLKNEVDFVVLTGDIVDFVILSRLPKDLKKLIDFDYEHTNWKTFKEIILGRNKKKRRGVITNEELLCPIFTLPGNHDFRPYHYDLRWGNLYKKMGLNANEALALNDELAANPITAITKSFRALKSYLIQINPALDYFLKLGNQNFIFLNSGPDSFKNIRDLISGHPSVTGLSNRQIKFLENIINFKIKKGENVFIFVHAPPINPTKKLSFLSRSKIKDIVDGFLDNLENLRESIIKKQGKKSLLARIDMHFNIKFGTISNNWERFMNFCKNYSLLTLAGHTHELKEFRLVEPTGFKSKFYDAPPFILKKVENPAAVYYDLYSEILNDSEAIEKYTPLVVHTPALGFGGYNNPKMVGAYREIKIQDGKLASFKVKFINR